MLLSHYSELLTKEEKHRLKLCKRASIRHRSLVSRALLRTTLSQYHGIDARNWRFTAGKYGKPQILEPGCGLKFNISHAQAYLALAVTRNRDVGLDIEFMDRAADYMRIANYFYSDIEQKNLAGLEPKQRKTRFFEYWTLKESYIKGRGSGLAIPLKQFGFLIGKDRIRIVFSGELEDCAEDWEFWCFEPYKDFRMALALHKNSQAETHIKFFMTVPLQGYTAISVPDISG